MADIPDALVEKAAQAVAEADYAAGRGILNRPDARFLARAVLAAVWSDVSAARPVVDRDALAEALARAEWTRRHDGKPWTSSEYDSQDERVKVALRSQVRGYANAVLAVVQDAADVRRGVADEIAERCDYEGDEVGVRHDDATWAEQERMRDAYHHAARIAVEVGEKP